MVCHAATPLRCWTCNAVRVERVPYGCRHPPGHDGEFGGLVVSQAHQCLDMSSRDDQCVARHLAERRGSQNHVHMLVVMYDGRVPVRRYDAVEVVAVGAGTLRDFDRCGHAEERTDCDLTLPVLRLAT